MKKLWFIAALLLVTAPLFAMSAADARALAENAQPTIQDAYWLLESINNPAIRADALDWKRTARVSKLDPKAALTVGGFSALAIELKLARGGWFYSLTGIQKYAAESLLDRKLLPSHFSWNRTLTGKELLGLVQGLRK